MAGRIEVHPDIDQVVLVNHPRYEPDALFCRDALDGWVDVQLVESKPGGWEPNAEMLDGIIGTTGRVAIGVVAGDGTFGDIAGALVRTGVLAERAAITSMRRGGNACDCGRAHHGRLRPHPRVPFSTQAYLTQAYALEAAITSAEGETEKSVALSYIGFGETAEASRRVQLPEYQDGRPYLRDVRIMLQTLASDHTFTITDEMGNATLRTLEFNKGSAMAKLGILPVRHWDPEFRINAVKATRPATARAAAGLLIGRGGGFNTAQPYTFTLNTPTTAHFDGDPRPGGLQPGSIVQIGLASQAYKLLATRRSAEYST